MDSKSHKDTNAWEYRERKLHMNIEDNNENKTSKEPKKPAMMLIISRELQIVTLSIHS